MTGGDTSHYTKSDYPKDKLFIRVLKGSATMKMILKTNIKRDRVPFSTRKNVPLALDFLLFVGVIRILSMDVRGGIE